MFDAKTMSLCTDTGFVFGKDGFIQRLDFFARSSLIHNDYNVRFYGLHVCQQQYNLAFSSFIAASFACRYKDVYCNGTTDTDLLDSYTKLCTVGINQFLMKLQASHSVKTTPPEEHFLNANRIIVDGINDLAEDINELFKTRVK